jgi:hypothetical protein
MLWRSGRLWSLWEMREHNAKTWLRTTKMLIRQISLTERASNPVDLAQVVDTLGRVADQCNEIGMPVSAVMAVELQEVLPKIKGLQNTMIVRELESLHNAIEGELKSILFLRVSPEFSKYYSTPQPFGPEVADRFPSAIQDIEQGAKVLAYGAGTATVFHMMRIMEVGLRSLAGALKIPYAPSWESYLIQIEKKITAKHRTKGIQWKRDEPFFRDVAGDLQMVKIAWRNPTMHIVRHYNQDEAEDVFRGVKRFMNRLAEKLSE